MSEAPGWLPGRPLDRDPGCPARSRIQRAAGAGRVGRRVQQLQAAPVAAW